MKFTEEHKQKISLALKGKPKPWCRKQRVEKTCAGCGKVFSLTPGQIREKRGKYCSRPCMYHSKEWRAQESNATAQRWKNGFNRKPCGNLISRIRILKGVAKGSNNPNWKGGITKRQVAIRNSHEYKEWRKKVYERDGYACVKCGVKGNGKNLEADHILPLSVILRTGKYPFDVNNGRTLCVACHAQTPTYGWRVWNLYLKPTGRRWCCA